MVFPTPWAEELKPQNEQTRESEAGKIRHRQRAYSLLPPNTRETGLTSPPAWVSLRSVTTGAPPNADREERDRTRADRTLLDLLRRAVESGVEKLAEGPESLRQLLGDLRLPKEMASLLAAQLEETKSEVTRVVVREIREFLERANLADELERILSRLTLEVRTQIRFVPNESRSGLARPTVRTRVGLKRDDDRAVEDDDPTAEDGSPSSRVPAPSDPPEDPRADDQNPPSSAASEERTT